MVSSKKLNALYYPFSRAGSLPSIKQFLLLYDQTTFLDPILDEDWRAHLFSNLADRYDGFDSYSDLAANFPVLISEGAIRVVDPATIRSRESCLTTASIISDLSDKNWMRLCNPVSAGIPFERCSSSDMPIWQIFKPKIPDRFLDTIDGNDELRQHIIGSGGDRYSWQLTYSAGSAIALNVHMSAAEELGLQLVSDSELHNRLLLAKLERQSQDKGAAGYGPDKAESVASGAMISIFDKLLPPETLNLVSVEEILKFRDHTSSLRAEFSEEIKRLVLKHESFINNRCGEVPSLLAAQLAADVKNYGDELQAVRDSIWPRLIDSITAAAPSRTSGAGYLASYISGSGYLMAASLLLHALHPLKSALEVSADLKKVRRSSTSAIAFLVRAKESFAR